MNPNTTAFLNFAKDKAGSWTWRAYSDTGMMYAENNGIEDLAACLEDAVKWLTTDPNAEPPTRRAPAPKRPRGRARR